MRAPPSSTGVSFIVLGLWRLFGISWRDALVHEGPPLPRRDALLLRRLPTMKIYAARAAPPRVPTLL